MCPVVVPSASDLAKDLRQRITMFHAGDELYSGAWLADFQRRGAVAWQVCTTALQVGPSKTCDEELAQAFCAQTLARLARAFTSCFQEPAVQKSARDNLEALLVVFAAGKALVWKQLSLALACAELWRGTWVAAAALNAHNLPALVRMELLALPSELLFDDRALPLTNRQLRESAGASLFRSSSTVFMFLLSDIADDSTPEEDCQKALRVLASWLRAVRKSLLWLPGVDAAAPLWHLGALGQHLLAAARVAPAEAAEVAQQLAKWKSAPQEATTVLKPLLGSLFLHDAAGAADLTPLWLLPLLNDLAEDFWPKAALGELDLDWEAIARHAFVGLGRVSTHIDSAHGERANFEDAECAISIWQTFAETLQSAVRAAESFCSSSSEAKPLFSPPPEKRTRRTHDRWLLSAAKLAESQPLQLIFQLVLDKLSEHLRLPAFLEDEDAVAIIQGARAAAESALLPWARLAGNPQAWGEQLLLPLRRVEAILADVSSSESEEIMAEERASEIEVMLWLFSAICSSMLEGHPSSSDVAVTTKLAVQSLEPKLAGLDHACPLWRTPLWTSVYSMATSVNSCNAMPCTSGPVLLEWMLQRSPSEAKTPETQEVTELLYARALEAACKRLPSGTSHPALGERLFMLAFSDWDPSSQQDERRVEVQALYLSALRFAMGEQPDALCNFMANTVMPKLCRAADDEAARSLSSCCWDGAPWPAHRVLFETLASLLPVGRPSADIEHPSLPIWRQAWKYLQAALLDYPVEAASNQPVTAAAQALRRAGLSCPVMLPEVLRLLASSVAKRDPEAQLNVLREIISDVPCPPVDRSKAAELLDAAVASAAEALLDRAQDLVESPDDLAAMFALLAEAVRPSASGTSGGGPCKDQLRPLVLMQPDFVCRCLHLISRALPECCSKTCAEQMIRFVTRLISTEEASPESHTWLLSSTLAPICSSLCSALAAQDFWTEPESLAEDGELLLTALEAMPEEFHSALATGLAQAGVSEHSKALLQQHMLSRGEWSQKGHWLEQLHQIVVEWQSERHLNVL
eukprot:TRINITY_DN4749_c0_g1_i2.p1 TRINITY_DN4749_c0_g1~~TRINITY_DN4749_c0_g1_i2.p1  ORF type:complete len:1074 (-),score=233.04 TRINITY_DN4749_c0_g1_i2:518-3622(-)